MTELAANKIVVGIDGTEASVAALRWATRQAHALHADVVAVHAWDPTARHLAAYAPVAAHPTDAEQRDEAAHLLASTLHAVFGARIDGAVRAVLAQGPPARVLLNHADGALLLALGRRSDKQRGLPALGAVGRECLRHASVPVVTVPAANRPTASLREADPNVLAGQTGPLLASRHG